MRSMAKYFFVSATVLPAVLFFSHYSISLAAGISSSTDITELNLEDRKELLIDVLNSSHAETNELKNYLADLQTSNDRWKEIKENLLDKLSNFDDHYQSVKDKINNSTSTITLEEVKKTARELKEWQENVYAPETDRVINAVLILKANNFLDTTQNRFDKVSTDIKKLEKQKLIKTASLKKYLSDISRHLNNISDSIGGAENMYLTSSVINGENSATSTQENAGRENSVASQENQNIIRKMIQNSLKELKVTYEIFFQINNKIKNGD